MPQNTKTYSFVWIDTKKISLACATKSKLEGALRRTLASAVYQAMGVHTQDLHHLRSVMDLAICLAVLWPIKVASNQVLPHFLKSSKPTSRNRSQGRLNTRCRNSLKRCLSRVLTKAITRINRSSTVCHCLPGSLTSRLIMPPNDSSSSRLWISESDSFSRCR